MEYLQITLEIVIGFIALFVLTRLLGKRQLNQITPFDFISALILGELVGNAVYDREIHVFFILYTIFLWGVLIISFEFLANNFFKLRKLLEGSPSVVIRQGKIDQQELKKNKMNITELQSLLRQKDVFSLREVEYAILEPNGSISVLKKPQNAAIIKQDLNLPGEEVYLPIDLIIDGKILQDNLKKAGLDQSWLKEQLAAKGIMEVKEVLHADWIAGKGLYVMEKERK